MPSPDEATGQGLAVVDICAAPQSILEDPIPPWSDAPVVLDATPIREAPAATEWQREEEELPSIPLQQAVASIDAPGTVSHNVSRSASPWSSMIHRLRTPTRWRRSLWLATWIALGMPLAAMIYRLSTERSPISSKSSVQAATGIHLAPAQMPPVAPSSVLANPQALPSAALEPSAKAPPTSSSSGSPDALPGPGFGYLTVHSSSESAVVYVTLKKYGATEEKLVVPCGQQFVSIGIPGQDRKEPTWLANTRTVQVRCGHLVEVTINGRSLK